MPVSGKHPPATAIKQARTMSNAHIHQHPHPNHDVPEELEPGTLPLDSDEGLVPALIPDDPEHERVVDPLSIQAWLDEGARRPVAGVR